MIWILVATMAQPNMPSINLPYQAIPAFGAYTRCLHDRMDKDVRAQTGTASDLRQVHSDAVAGCREVRARELVRGIAAVDDKRMPLASQFRNVREAQAAVRRAFDRLDTDFEIDKVR